MGWTFGQSSKVYSIELWNCPVVNDDLHDLHFQRNSKTSQTDFFIEAIKVCIWCSIKTYYHIAQSHLFRSIWCLFRDALIGVFFYSQKLRPRHANSTHGEVRFKVFLCQLLCRCVDQLIPEQKKESELHKVLVAVWRYKVVASLRLKILFSWHCCS